MGRLAGKIAVITGGGSGIGFATAKLFAAEGATVYITGRNLEKLQKAARNIGDNVEALQSDVTVQEDLDRLFQEIGKSEEQIDILFANAGWAEFKPLGQIDEQHYDKIFDGNVKGVLFTVQKALPLLREGSSVILNSSVVGSKGLASNSVYAASKAALRSFARTWTTDLKPRRIRVNAISPGPVDTEGLSELLGDDEFGRKRREAFASTVPLGRTAKAEEIARAVLFLASDDSSYVTGAELFVDGGMGQV